ncbi:MAG: Peptidase M50 [Parcubacteria bacterium C7867-003]|nr:MAG: Peptidase M50 [Parcubacteria bacterium C7867-003]
MQIDFIFQIIILIFSVVVHEVSHGFMAYRLGDNTAKFEGRLTLNPFKHLEWFGSFILPVISYMTGGFIIGWAKPVPFNPYNLSDQKWGEAKVAIAGPLSNIAIAVFFGLLIRFGALATIGGSFVYFASMIVFINLILATFNLIPVPPLDGSKILFSLLPYSMRNVQEWFERNSIFILIIFVFFLWKFVLPLIQLEFLLITGLKIT